MLSGFTDGHGAPDGRGRYLAKELAAVIGAVVFSIVLAVRTSKIPKNYGAPLEFHRCGCIRMVMKAHLFADFGARGDNGVTEWFKRIVT